MTDTANLEFLKGYTPTLDKTRDYGTIHGEGRQYAETYEQDGFHFDAAGKFIPELVTDANRKDLEKKARIRLAQEAAQAAMRAVLEGEDPEAAAALKVSVSDSTKLDPADIDLGAWAASGGLEPKVPFPTISTLVAAKYGDKPSSKASAIDIITKGTPLKIEA